KAEVQEAERRFTEMLILPIVRVDAHLLQLPTRDNCLLQVPLQELGKPFLQFGTGHELEHHSVEKRPAFVIMLVGCEHDLLVCLPPHKCERSRAYRCVSKIPSRLFHLFLRHHCSVGESKDEQERGQWLFQNHAESITILYLQTLHAGRFACPELLGSLNMLEEPGHGQRLGWIEEAPEG